MPKIAIWRTGHEIADTVAKAMSSLPDSDVLHVSKLTHDIIQKYDYHIGYGILRGTENVFKVCEAVGKPWFNVDRGYINPGHYDGYYRVSLRGTQHTQCNLRKLRTIERENKRFDSLEVRFEPWKGLCCDKHALICPPTGYAGEFFNVNLKEWYDEVKKTIFLLGFKKAILRPKHTKKPLQKHLNKSGVVITYNSAVGWEALRQGIPVVSDKKISIIGTNCADITLDKLSSFQHNHRRELFEAMASLQLTLGEMRAGKLWPLMNRLLSI